MRTKEQNRECERNKAKVRGGYIYERAVGRTSHGIPIINLLPLPGIENAKRVEIKTNADGTTFTGRVIE
jgi:hypothetical protein